MKHSPGPWTARKNINGSIDLFAADRVILCGARLINQPANISLIAAAPEMLDALRTMLRESDELFGVDDPYNDDNPSRHQDVHELIKRIEGE